MTDPPVSVVVDCSKTGPPDPELAAHFDQAALELLRNGELEKAGQLMQEAKEILAASTVATETIVPLTDDQIAQHALDQASGLEQAKAARAAEINGALAATDKWAARAVEEGAAMPPARVKYRQTLRGLFAAVAAAADQSALDKIAVPPPPKNPS